MIGYATIGTKDMETAKAYWTELLELLGAKPMMDMGRIAFIGSGMDQPMLAVCVTYNENDPQQDRGAVALRPSRGRSCGRRKPGRVRRSGAT